VAILVSAEQPLKQVGVRIGAHEVIVDRTLSAAGRAVRTWFGGRSQLTG
jgi:hypothetical protein